MTVFKEKVLPEAKVIGFNFQSETNEYLQEKSGASYYKIPEVLKIDLIRNENTIRADKFIRGTERTSGRYKFQTGLRQITSQLFYGDHFEIIEGKKKNSFILFQFLEKGLKLQVHFFNHFNLFPRSRGKFITAYLKSLSHEKGEHR